MKRLKIALQVLLIHRHRHPIHTWRCLPLLPPKRPFERLDVDMVKQRREPGLARPSGRVVHPNKRLRPGHPALRLALPVLVRDPQWSGSSLRSARCLRRHLQYYTPIRHPADQRARPLVSLGTRPLR